MADSKLQWQKMPGGGSSTYKGGQYCGPGWGFTKEDVRSGKIRELPKALDAIDRACAAHDQCYQDYGYFTASCNQTLAKNLYKVILNPESTEQQRMDAVIMAAIFQIEASHVDPEIAKAKFTYTFMKTTLEKIWNNANLTMGQAIYQMQRQIYNVYGSPFGPYGTF